MADPASHHTRQAPAMVKKSYNYRLARYKRLATPRHQTKLVIQGWPGSYRWCDHEGKMHYHPGSAKTADIG